jgi:hypothetical protein
MRAIQRVTEGTGSYADSASPSAGFSQREIGDQGHGATLSIAVEITTAFSHRPTLLRTL